MANAGQRDLPPSTMKVTVYKSKEPGRTAPWGVRHYVGRKPKRKFFPSREEAEAYARELRETLRSGANAYDVSVGLRMLAGTGYKLPDVIRAGLAAFRAGDAAGASPSATFADGAAKVMKTAKERGRRSTTMDGYESAYCSLNKFFGPRIGMSITGADVAGYFESLADKRGNAGGASPYTKRTLLIYIRMALRALGITNPLPGFTVAVPKAKSIKFFTVEQVEEILGATHPNERGIVALALFSAIRPETLERLPPECVNVVDRMVRIPPEFSKSGVGNCLEGGQVVDGRIVLPGIEEILWAWLKKHPFEPRPWAALQRRLAIAIKDKWPQDGRGEWVHDGLRHTGATYYRALHGDAATAQLLTHGDIKLVHRNYCGLTSRAEANKFFNLGPDKVTFQPRERRDSHKKIAWPSDEDLARLLAEKPATEIARELGCSDVGVLRRCCRRGIKTLGRGAWTKARLSASQPDVGTVKIVA